MSHSAENPKKSSMLGKRFVSGKSRGGFGKIKLEQSRIEKTTALKKQNSNIACWFTEKTKYLNLNLSF